MDDNQSESVDAPKTVAQYMGHSDRRVGDSLCERVDRSITRFQDTPHAGLAGGRLFITGEYGMRHRSPKDGADVIVFVEVQATPVPTVESEAKEVVSHIVGPLHDRVAPEIENALDRPCDIAFFPQPELAEAAGVESIRPITTAARAASGLHTYEWREDPAVDDETTVYDARRREFVEIGKLE